MEARAAGRAARRKRSASGYRSAAATGLAVALLLAGCVTSGPGGQGAGTAAGRYTLGEPYEIEGVAYRPAEDLGYDETGTAERYEAPAAGGQTANGEPFDPEAMTAAHRTLPLPSLVRVTNLYTRRSVVLRVNDRGPMANDRILAVTPRAAEMLGFTGDGVAEVRVQILPQESLALAELAGRRAGGPAAAEAGAGEGTDDAVAAAPDESPVPPTAAAAEGESGYYVQAGAFAVRANADRMLARLEPVGATRLAPLTIDGVEYFRVWLGPFASEEDAAAARERIVASGLASQATIVDD